MNQEIKRVYIGGLSKNVNEQDIANRLRPFGSISNVNIIYQQETGESRGFAYATVKTTPTLWKKCVSTLNGTIWKGMKLRIEDAKPDYKKRLQDQREQEHKPAEPQVSGTHTSKKRKQDTVTLADDMNLVTDKNADGRKGWKKARYGRAVAVMRLRKDDGTKVVFNPQHYQNNLKRFTERDLELLEQMPSDALSSESRAVNNKSDGHTNYAEVKDNSTIKNNVMETDDLIAKNLASTPMPAVSKDVRAEINTDLKQLFGPAAVKHESPINAVSSTHKQPQNPKNKAIESQSMIPAMSESAPLFFFHFGDKSLEKRDEITAQWEESRKELTAEFKRKHKSVTKKLSKLKKKGWYTEGKIQD
ncbi:7456_t:CDS:10 [Paraglomus brasilianum]|uniref:7456_t:CDS:1 n=1 Tax=Paraglomus brasilianum TaxID=144538 RepID=A0A9N8ZSD3_9GLOM|nr:7456_t:CDS:10 [Paraglomus brasilianum]